MLIPEIDMITFDAIKRVRQELRESIKRGDTFADTTKVYERLLNLYSTLNVEKILESAQEEFKKAA